MKLNMVLFSATVISLLAPSAQAANILELYDYHGDEVTAKANQNWLGLYAKDGKCELRPTKVSIKMVHDEIIDEDDLKAKSGKRVSVPGKEKPIFVFAGIRGLKAGPVVSSPIKNKDHLALNEKIKISLSKREATLTVTGKRKDAEYLTGFVVTLESGGVKQQIVQAKQVSAESTPKLMWCGDLDGDGKLDFVMDTSTHYNASNVTLFLSSQAKPGKLVKEVASQYATGC